MPGLVTDQHEVRARLEGPGRMGMIIKVFHGQMNFLKILPAFFVFFIKKLDRLSFFPDTKLTSGAR